MKGYVETNCSSKCGGIKKMNHDDADHPLIDFVTVGLLNRIP